MFAMGPSLLAGGVAAFKPSSLSGNTLWLDAADASTISATGGLVDQWRDKSGNVNHAAGSTTARFTTGAATQNSLNVMQVANGNLMTLTSALTDTNITIISVAKVIGGGASGQTIMAGGGTTPPLFAFVTAQLSWDGNLFFANNGSVANIYSVTKTAANFESLFAGSSSTASATGTFSANASSFNQIGQYGGLSAYNFAGIFGELIAYNRVLTAGELGQVFTYLKAKWGTP